MKWGLVIGFCTLNALILGSNSVRVKRQQSIHANVDVSGTALGEETVGDGDAEVTSDDLSGTEGNVVANGAAAGAGDSLVVISSGLNSTCTGPDCDAESEDEILDTGRVVSEAGEGGESAAAVDIDSKFQSRTGLRERFNRQRVTAFGSAKTFVQFHPTSEIEIIGTSSADAENEASSLIQLEADNDNGDSFGIGFAESSMNGTDQGTLNNQLNINSTANGTELIAVAASKINITQDSGSFDGAGISLVDKDPERHKSSISNTQLQHGSDDGGNAKVDVISTAKDTHNSAGAASAAESIGYVPGEGSVVGSKGAYAERDSINETLLANVDSTLSHEGPESEGALTSQVELCRNRKDDPNCEKAVKAKGGASNYVIEGSADSVIGAKADASNDSIATVNVDNSAAGIALALGSEAELNITENGNEISQESSAGHSMTGSGQNGGSAIGSIALEHGTGVPDESTLEQDIEGEFSSDDGTRSEIDAEASSSLFDRKRAALRLNFAKGGAHGSGSQGSSASGSIRTRLEQNRNVINSRFRGHAVGENSAVAGSNAQTEALSKTGLLNVLTAANEVEVEAAESEAQSETSNTFDGQGNGHVTSDVLGRGSGGTPIRVTIHNLIDKEQLHLAQKRRKREIPKSLQGFLQRHPERLESAGVQRILALLERVPSHVHGDGGHAIRIATVTHPEESRPPIPSRASKNFRKEKASTEMGSNDYEDDDFSDESYEYYADDAPEEPDSDVLETETYEEEGTLDNGAHFYYKAVVTRPGHGVDSGYEVRRHRNGISVFAHSSHNHGGKKRSKREAVTEDRDEGSAYGSVVSNGTNLIEGRSKITVPLEGEGETTGLSYVKGSAAGDNRAETDLGAQIAITQEEGVIETNSGQASALANGGSALTEGNTESHGSQSGKGSGKSTATSIADSFGPGSAKVMANSTLSKKKGDEESTTDVRVVGEGTAEGETGKDIVTLLGSAHVRQNTSAPEDNWSEGIASGSSSATKGRATSLIEASRQKMANFVLRSSRRSRIRGSLHLGQTESGDSLAIVDSNAIVNDEGVENTAQLELANVDAADTEAVVDSFIENEIETASFSHLGLSNDTGEGTANQTALLDIYANENETSAWGNHSGIVTSDGRFEAEMDSLLGLQTNLSGTESRVGGYQSQAISGTDGEGTFEIEQSAQGDEEGVEAKASGSVVSSGTSHSLQNGLSQSIEGDGLNKTMAALSSVSSSGNVLSESDSKGELEHRKDGTSILFTGTNGNAEGKEGEETGILLESASTLEDLEDLKIMFQAQVANSSVKGDASNATGTQTNSIDDSLMTSDSFIEGNAGGAGTASARASITAESIGQDFQESTLNTGIESEAAGDDVKTHVSVQATDTDIEGIQDSFQRIRSKFGASSRSGRITFGTKGNIIRTRKLGLS